MRLTEGKFLGPRRPLDRLGFVSSVVLVLALRYLPFTVGGLVTIIATLAGYDDSTAIGAGLVGLGGVAWLGGDLWRWSVRVSADLGAAERIRYLWPKVTSHCGWDSPATGQPGIIRRPLLVDVGFKGSVGVVTFRPLGDQDPQSWDQVSEALRRSLGAHSVAVSESPLVPGVLVAKISMVPLPTLAHAPQGVAP